MEILSGKLTIEDTPSVARSSSREEICGAGQVYSANCEHDLLTRSREAVSSNVKGASVYRVPRRTERILHNSWPSCRRYFTLGRGFARWIKTRRRKKSLRGAVDLVCPCLSRGALHPRGRCSSRVQFRRRGRRSWSRLLAAGRILLIPAAFLLRREASLQQKKEAVSLECPCNFISCRGIHRPPGDYSRRGYRRSEDVNGRNRAISSGLRPPSRRLAGSLSSLSALFPGEIFFKVV